MVVMVVMVVVMVVMVVCGGGGGGGGSGGGKKGHIEVSLKNETMVPLHVATDPIITLGK